MARRNYKDSEHITDHVVFRRAFHPTRHEIQTGLQHQNDEAQKTFTSFHVAVALLFSIVKTTFPEALQSKLTIVGNF